jgi:hypothetical protein
VSEEAAGGGEASPIAETYARRLGERRARAGTLLRTDRRLSAARLAVFFGGAALSLAVFFGRVLSPAWLLPPALVFGALLLVHDRVIRRRERAERAVAFYERGLARIAHRFAGTGEPGERFRDPRHPYAEDLDLFGRGSLFELLCAARTREGEERLAAWLLAPAAPAEVRERQQAVAELRERLDLREDLAVLGEDVRAGLHAAALRRWGEAPAAFSRPTLLRALGAALSALSLAALWLWIRGDSGPLPFLGALVVQALFAHALRAPVARVVGAVDLPARDLALLSELLARLEAERPASARLTALRAELDGDGHPPSKRIAQLRLRVDLLEARRNQLFAPLAALLLWKTQCALALEAWRRGGGPAVGRWIDAVGEIEALASLAGFAGERADARFPELAEGAPRFEAAGLGHPLIPPRRCVRNDLRLGAEPAVLVVSGSNMSGKSTFLRSAGTAAVLAQAGAPVCAERLALSPLQVGASLRVQDSLQEGTSRFQAELLRLRAVKELAERGAPPVLFLLDEILHGTNSHDRALGAEAVVRGLVERGAMGLVTTHDLALARVADALAPRAANVHFEDQMVDGRMVFDYRLRPGVVTRGNALELMRAMGLV